MTDMALPPAHPPSAPGAAEEKTGSIVVTSDGRSTRVKRILKGICWTLLTIFLLGLFTLLKLPEDRIRNYVQGMIAAQLSSQGITLNAQQSWVSIGWGLSYTMKDITVNFPPPQEPSKIEQITVSPSMIALITGKAGAKIAIYNKDGSLIANYSQSLAANSGQMSLSFNADKIDLGAMGALPVLANVKGSAIVSGSGSVSGDTNVPSTLSGQVNLDLSKIVIDQQAVMGFAIPRLSISEGKADVAINQGKASIRTFQLGKPTLATDDIRAKATGDVVLGRSWQYSTLNLRVDFSLSQNVLKALPLVDALLGAGKQADGSYAYNLSGPVFSPTPVPVTGAAK